MTEPPYFGTANEPYEPPPDRPYQPPPDQQPYDPPADWLYQPPPDKPYRSPHDQPVQPPADQPVRPYQMPPDQPLAARRRSAPPRPMSWGREFSAETVRNQSFGKPSLGKRGYSADEVDRYLQVIAAALDGRSRLSANDVHNVSFKKPPLGRRGYDEEEVDAFLGAIEDQLRARERVTDQLPLADQPPPDQPEQPRKWRRRLKIGVISATTRRSITGSRLARSRTGSATR